ncbi:MAG: radical SAM protein [Candidatus Omnitrophota bacterium]
MPNYKDKKDSCVEITNETIPFIYLFTSHGYNFVLDLHTNKIFSLEPREAEVIEKWLKGVKFADLSKEFPKEAATIKVFQDRGLFCCQPPEGLAYGIDWEGVCDNILNKRAMTIIEITQQCNLRCKYCTFGGGFKDHRTLSSKNMSEEVLKKSILSALKHGSDLDEIFITYYGGEPLCAFDLLKTSVSFAQKISSGKNINFSLTTNATLIDREKASFLKEAGFNVLVSIDGPKYMHDRYRVFADGTGSYDYTIKGLKTLLDVYPTELHYKIGLNMVVPSSEWIPLSGELWDNEKWLPRTLKAKAKVVDPPNGFQFPELPTCAKSKNIKEEWLSSFTATGSSEKNTLLSEIYDTSLASIHQRPTFPNYRRTFFPNGCCIPGGRKIYIRVDGVYQICENAHGAPTIGSVFQGVDLQQIKKIINDYCELSFQNCKTCWAISLCSLCYVNAYEKGMFSVDRKCKSCAFIREYLASDLNLYGWISQKYPQKLVEWDKIVMI